MPKIINEDDLYKLDSTGLVKSNNGQRIFQPGSNELQLMKRELAHVARDVRVCKDAIKLTAGTPKRLAAVARDIEICKDAIKQAEGPQIQEQRSLVFAVSRDETGYISKVTSDSREFIFVRDRHNQITRIEVRDND